MLEVQRYVQAVPLVAMNALSAACLATQGLVKVRVDRKLVFPLSLYLLSIAESGERKTFTEKFFIHGMEKWTAEQLRLVEPKLATTRRIPRSGTRRKRGWKAASPKPPAKARPTPCRRFARSCAI
ncbi:MAG: DUF3987 domain-containing protein [Thiolinea sp.]